MILGKFGFIKQLLVITSGQRNLFTFKFFLTKLDNLKAPKKSGHSLEMTKSMLLTDTAGRH